MEEILNKSGWDDFSFVKDKKGMYSCECSLFGEELIVINFSINK